MTETRKLRVFLCHSSQDKLVVRDLYQRLLAEGWIDPWLDEEKLLPGQDWDLEIEKAVESADAVIVCLSNNSITKEGYVQKELRKVLDTADEKPEGAIFVIPLRFDGMQIPRRLKMWQCVDYFPIQARSAAVFRLLMSLKRRADDSAIPVASIPSFILPEDIAVEVRILDHSGNIKNDFYFLTKPHVTVHRLLINIMKEYFLELPDLVENYEVNLVLSQHDHIDRLAVGNESVIIIRPK